MGILIAFEGIDGAGKTTQVQLLGEALRAAGEHVVVSKEPTDGPWGRRIRQSAQTGRLPLEEELHAFIEDRKEHIGHTIGPGLQNGRVIILDRYFYSTVAYQGVRGADPRELLERMLSFAPVPDIVFLLDVDPAVSLSRIAHGRGETPNQFERLDQLRAVRDVFRWLAETDSRIQTIDAHQSVHDVHRAIVEVLIAGVFTKYTAKPYDCNRDCWYCSFRETNTCRWLTLQDALRAGLAATAHQ